MTTAIYPYFQYLWVVCFLFCSAIPAFGGLRLTVIYDNLPYEEGVEPDWGFSCLIDTGRKKILFDTGKDSDILFSNANKLGVQLEDVDAIIISHLHKDHAGGLFPMLDIQPKAIVYLPEVKPEMREMFQHRGTKFFRVNKPMQIGKGMFLTGAMGVGMPEQALIINMPYGLMIIAGCSHPGIINIIKKAKALFHRPVYLVLGGFHTMPKSAQGLLDVIHEFRSLGVQKVGPAHCTEQNTRAYFKYGYGKDFVSIGAGKVLSFFFKNKRRRPVSPSIDVFDPYENIEPFAPM